MEDKDSWMQKKGKNKVYLLTLISVMQLMVINKNELKQLLKYYYFT